MHNTHRHALNTRVLIASVATLIATTVFLHQMYFAPPVQALGGGSGAISLTTLGAAYTQNFDTLANTGTTNALTINGWFLDETGPSARNNGQYAASTGSDTGGDVYSFGATSSMERAFGTLFSGTLNSRIGEQFTNNTGSTVTTLDVSYVGEMWRAGVTNPWRSRPPRFSTQYDCDQPDDWNLG